MAAFDLTDLASVRRLMNTPADEHEQDAIVEVLISAASKAIAKHTNREFAPMRDAVTRTFEYQPGSGFLDFGHYDARVITSVAAESTTLDAAYWRAVPIGQPEGVYTGLKLYVPSVNPSAIFYERLINVTADWGFPSVPDDVAQACALAVALWMRRDVSTFATTFNIDTARYERPEALPAAVAGIVGNYKRLTYL